MAFFEGFTLEHVDGGAGATLRVRHGGEGPPVVLLHGHPRTHATWHRVAALLAPTHAVVCPDLRGYGQASKVEPYTKRAMANDIVGLMRAFGHDRFDVVGHDRGSYVAMRLALDHADAVERLVLLESMPLVERLERTDWQFALDWWHWWFLGQTDKPAERVINADPDAWYRVTSEPMGEEAFADLQRALHDPNVVHGMLEDYRAGLREDREHEEADRAAGNRITCPLLVVAALQDDPDLVYEDSLLELALLGDRRSKRRDQLRPPYVRGKARRTRRAATGIPRAIGEGSSNRRRLMIVRLAARVADLESAVTRQCRHHRCPTRGTPRDLSADLRATSCRP